MKYRNALRWALVAVHGLFWAGGIVSYMVGGAPPEDAAWAAPLFLLLAALVVLAWAAPRDMPALLGAGLIGFGAEIPGTHLGVPFGHYDYTQVLFPHLFGVPLVLTAAWLILIAYVRDMLQPLERRPLPFALWGAAWMTVIDLVLDPLAGGPLNYWVWERDGWYYGIPWTNFAGWFAVSLVILLVFRRPWRPNAAARWLGLSVIAFFGLIALAYGYWEPLAIAIGLTVLHSGLLAKQPASANAEASAL